MPPLFDPDNRPGLLVSVRDAAEALAALAGGAHVIDVKEPNRGSLGAADPETIAAVIRAVEGRVPVTAAAGEMIDLVKTTQSPLPHGVALFKIGLARCGTLPDWPSRWSETIKSLWPNPDASSHAVAVAYADWQSAQAPKPSDVLHAAIDIGCPVLLVDTCDKSAGALFDHWPIQQLAAFVESVQSHGLRIVLAGSLAGAPISVAARLRPDLVAVRAAACEFGRGGTVSKDRVTGLLRTLAAAPDLLRKPAITSPG
jgi:uncharacterized protein (UPF0264 family)